MRTLVWASYMAGSPVYRYYAWTYSLLFRWSFTCYSTCYWIREKLQCEYYRHQQRILLTETSVAAAIDTLICIFMWRYKERLCMRRTGHESESDAMSVNYTWCWRHWLFVPWWLWKQGSVSWIPKPLLWGGARQTYVPHGRQSIGDCCLDEAVPGHLSKQRM